MSHANVHGNDCPTINSNDCPTINTSSSVIIFFTTLNAVLSGNGSYEIKHVWLVFHYHGGGTIFTKSPLPSFTTTVQYWPPDGPQTHCNIVSIILISMLSSDIEILKKQKAERSYTAPIKGKPEKDAYRKSYTSKLQT